MIVYNAALSYLIRSVAQPGSAPPWGGGGREFKSRRSDHLTIQIPFSPPFLKNNLKYLKF